MIDYLLIRQDGSIFQRGSCLSLGDIPVVPGTQSEVITKEDLRGPSKPAAPTYEQFRAMDYPVIGDQLDVLWKIISSSGIAKDIPEARNMLDRISAVKAKHPKSTQ